MDVSIYNGERKRMDSNSFSPLERFMLLKKVIIKNTRTRLCSHTHTLCTVFFSLCSITHGSGGGGGGGGGRGGSFVFSTARE